MTDMQWERWARLSGIGFVVLFVAAFLTYGDAPGPNASSQDLISFYDGDRGRILTATMLMGGAQILFLLFVGALASALREAGKGGWAAASIAGAASLVGFFFVLVGVNAALAFQIAGEGDEGVVMALSDLQWALIVLVSFPGAALLLAASMGLWRAGIVPDWFGWLGLAAAIAMLLGGTTWANSGFWAPDGAYCAWVTPIVFVAWAFVASWLLYRAASAIERVPETASARPV
jgi:hypothetical protein